MEGKLRLLNDIFGACSFKSSSVVTNFSYIRIIASGFGSGSDCKIYLWIICVTPVHTCYVPLITGMQPPVGNICAI